MSSSIRERVSPDDVHVGGATGITTEPTLIQLMIHSHADSSITYSFPREIVVFVTQLLFLDITLFARTTTSLLRDFVRINTYFTRCVICLN